MAQGLSTELVPSGRSTPDVVHMETEDDMSNLMQQTRASSRGNTTTPVAPATAAATVTTRPVNPSPPPSADVPIGLGPGVTQGAPNRYTLQQNMQAQSASVMFDDFDSHIVPATASSTALPVGSTRTTTAAAMGTLAGAVTTGISAADSPPLSNSPPGTASHAPLDAFDLDVDHLGATDLGGWFSEDWVTSNEFSAT